MDSKANTTDEAQRATGPDDELLEPQQAADLMGIEVKSLMAARARGSAPRSVVLGRRPLFLRTAVEAAAREPERTPCPPWCDQDGRDAHGYDVWTEDPTVWTRFHQISMPDSWCVSRREDVRGGVSDLGPVEVSYHGDEDAMTVEQARQFATALQAAIERARQVDADQVRVENLV
ncbi:MAG TPA: hypothetical protein VFH38_09410 [Jatrophihabitans sp.]|nr:hypothetical protein [Jatrophihabitans sp.]